MKYDVIGFPKAGSVSTQRWLSLNHDCVKTEWPYMWSKEKLRDHLGDRIPILVIRNKHDALWSFYEYFGYKGVIPFEDFLNLRIRSTNFKNLTPLEIYDYDRWIEYLKEFNPVVYKLEDLQKLEDYPHENKTVLKTTIPEQYSIHLNSIGINPY